jgi:hypothetical protein
MKRLGIYGCLLENYGPVLPCSLLGAMIVSGRSPLDKRDTVFVALGSCVTSAVCVGRCATVREMEEGPLGSAVRCRS